MKKNHISKNSKNKKRNTTYHDTYHETLKNLVFYQINSQQLQNTSIFSFVSIRGLLAKEKINTRSYLRLGYAITPITLCELTDHRKTSFVFSKTKYRKYPSLKKCRRVLNHPIRDRWYNTNLSLKTIEYKKYYQALELSLYKIYSLRPRTCTHYKFICSNKDNLHRVSHLLCILKKFRNCTKLQYLEIMPLRFKMSVREENIINKIQFKIIFKPKNVKTVTFIPTVDNYLPDCALSKFIKKQPLRNYKKKKKEIQFYKNIYYKNCKLYKKRGYDLVELDLKKVQKYRKMEQRKRQERLSHLLLAQSFWIGYCLGKLNKEINDIPLSEKSPAFYYFKNLKTKWNSI